MYREFNDLSGNGTLNKSEQCKRLNIFMDQVEKASEEGLVMKFGGL